MKDQHTKITGYRDLSQTEIDLMNEIKSAAARIEELIGKIANHHAEQWVASDESERERILAATPGQWAMIGKQTIQTGLMQLTRSVAQPSSF